MSDLQYDIAEHDGGWVYVIDGKRSPVFDTRAEAEEAAKAAASRQEEQKDRLDEGLEDTFPASDPVSATRPHNG